MPRRRAAMPDSASSTTRLASAAVMSAWSYGGETSTTSTPTTGSSRQTRRTASSSCARGQAAGLGCAGAGRVPGVGDVDVDRQEHAVAVVDRDAERLVEAVVEAAGDDLGHLEGPHPLLGHPVQRLRPGPVAAQPDLQEPVAARGARLDQPAHRLAVPVERAELDVAGVGVRVEVHDRDPAVAVLAGDAGDVGQGDRVVAAEHDRDRAARRDRGHRLGQRRQRPLDVARAASRRHRRRAPAGPAARRPAAPGAAASRRAAR